MGEEKGAEFLLIPPYTVYQPLGEEKGAELLNIPFYVLTNGRGEGYTSPPHT
jgi:hypothetical protein